MKYYVSLVSLSFIFILWKSISPSELSLIIFLLSTRLGYQNLKAKGKGKEGRMFQKKVFSTLYGGGSGVIRGAKFSLSSDF